MGDKEWEIERNDRVQPIDPKAGHGQHLKGYSIV
jgi:hypothetical protein